MKALTLWQPWASLISWGEKAYETRNWQTLYRGPLAIHASLNEEGGEVLLENAFYREAMRRHGAKKFGDLPFGKVLCVVDLTDVKRIHGVDGGVIFGNMLSEKEENLGDYSHGRFAWKLENVRMCRMPLTARGRQGLWNWPFMPSELRFMV